MQTVRGISDANFLQSHLVLSILFYFFNFSFCIWCNALFLNRFIKFVRSNFFLFCSLPSLNLYTSHDSRRDSVFYAPQHSCSSSSWILQYVILHYAVADTSDFSHDTCVVCVVWCSQCNSCIVSIPAYRASDSTMHWQRPLSMHALS